MTNPSRPTVQPTLAGALAMVFTILAIGAPMSMLAGCEKKKPPPVVEVAPPPPPPIPDPVQVDPIMQSMSPSAKVQFPQFAAPHSDGLARAVIAFADALAKGDGTKFGSMLNPITAKPLLAQLQIDGSWDTSTAAIEAVRVVLVDDGVNPDATSAAVYFAVQDPKGAYVMGWGAAKVGDQWTFAGAPATETEKHRASDWDSVGFAGLISDSLPEAIETIDVPEPPAEPAPGDAPPHPPGDGAPAPAPGTGG